MRWAAGGRNGMRASAVPSVRRLAAPVSAAVALVLVFSGGSSAAAEPPVPAPGGTAVGLPSGSAGPVTSTAAPVPGGTPALPTGPVTSSPAGPADPPSPSAHSSVPPSPSRPSGTAPVAEGGLAVPRLSLPFSVMNWLESAPAFVSSPSSPFPPPSPPRVPPPSAGRTDGPARPTHEPGDGPGPQDAGPGPLRPPGPARPDLHGHVGERPDPGRQMYGPRASAGPRGWPPAVGGGSGTPSSSVPPGQSGGTAPPESSAAAGGQDEGQQPTSAPDTGRPVMRVLPLGAGLLLVGLGLGFLGLRMRRR